MPLRHQDTKVHKEFIIKALRLVQLSALVPWWQRKVLFGVVSTFQHFNNIKTIPNINCINTFNNLYLVIKQVNNRNH